MTGLGTLAHLDFNHAYLRVLRLNRKAFGVEASVSGTATEIAAAQLPGQVAAVFAVVRADAAFTGIVGKVAKLGALVEGANRIRAQGAKAHGRNIEDRRRVRLGALRAADDGSKTGGVGQWGRAHGVTDKLKAGLIHVNQGAEGFVGALILGP